MICRGKPRRRSSTQIFLFGVVGIENADGTPR
jgi:hypothetical protein